MIGMTPDILAAIRPHLTLFGPPQPSPASADRVVAAALAQTLTGAAAPASLVPAAAQPPPDLLTTRITASALGPGNARAMRRAIVRFGAMLPGGYQILVWGNGP